MHITPRPSFIKRLPGKVAIPPGEGRGRLYIEAADARSIKAARVLEENFPAAKMLRAEGRGFPLRLIVKEAGAAPGGRGEEEYSLRITPDGAAISSISEDGLLRGAATFLQVGRIEGGQFIIPCIEIRDKPLFRYRCAADWLVNAEFNRWALDRGDGIEAFLSRVKRKLQFCFENKINMVWFDGFGWDTERFPGYAALMKECTASAGNLGIKLVFGGYGGGYGTAYQKGEIYRYGYFGEVYQNKLPFPGGDTYPCRGWPGNSSRNYGTCLSNEGLARAKLKEMKKFAAEINPGFMYIHDIDAGPWNLTVETWRQRCPECRRRWPNDDLSAEDGQAGALAQWYGRVRRELSSLRPGGGYSPYEDLILIFISPGYTHYSDVKPKGVWNLQKEYFANLSRFIGPAPGVEFGLREQFCEDNGEGRVEGLSRALDENGCGHGIHVISFGGGDNYLSDDLVNISGSMAHLFAGAESVCLSNGGMHQEPVQLMNADFLWSGSAGGYRESPPDGASAVELYEKIAAGEHFPKAVYGPGGIIDKTCARLWGKEAGELMDRALKSGRQGRHPVSHVWWSVTNTVTALKEGLPVSDYNCRKEWAGRKNATESALVSAGEAARISDDEDIKWFVLCLETGRRFAEAVEALMNLKSRTGAASGAGMENMLSELEKFIEDNIPTEKTDILGGDPGCWAETIDQIRKLAASYEKADGEQAACGDYIVGWDISGPFESGSGIGPLEYPKNGEIERGEPRIFKRAIYPFCEIKKTRLDNKVKEKVVYFIKRIEFSSPADAELRIGYDAPVKVWIDGRDAFCDSAGHKPASPDSAVIPLGGKEGLREIVIALMPKKREDCGIFARLCGAGRPEGF